MRADESIRPMLARQILLLGVSVLAAGYRTTRDVRWYTQRRLVRP